MSAGSRQALSLSLPSSSPCFHNSPLGSSQPPSVAVHAFHMCQRGSRCVPGRAVRVASLRTSNHVCPPRRPRVCSNKSLGLINGSPSKMVFLLFGFGVGEPSGTHPPRSPNTTQTTFPFDSELRSKAVTGWSGELHYSSITPNESGGHPY